MADKQPKMPEVGPIGRNLIAAVEGLREARGMTYRKLSAALEEIGRPIFPLGLSRLGRGERRVDVDELVALAIVLGVNPSALLFPRDADGDDLIELAPHVQQRADIAWRWADGVMPLPDEPAGGSRKEGEVFREQMADFQRHSRPHGGTPEDPPMVEQIRELLKLWETAYADWANPENYDMRVKRLERELKRVILRSEDELERLQREGIDAEERRKGTPLEGRQRLDEASLEARDRLYDASRETRDRHTASRVDLQSLLPKEDDQ
jgi:transcriptional regulator with XRE-family HTH domain